MAKTTQPTPPTATTPSPVTEPAKAPARGKHAMQTTYTGVYQSSKQRGQLPTKPGTVVGAAQALLASGTPVLASTLATAIAALGLRGTHTVAGMLYHASNHMGYSYEVVGPGSAGCTVQLLSTLPVAPGAK